MSRGLTNEGREELQALQTAISEALRFRKHGEGGAGEGELEGKN